MQSVLNPLALGYLPLELSVGIRELGSALSDVGFEVFEQVLQCQLRLLAIANIESGDQSRDAIAILH